MVNGDIPFTMTSLNPVFRIGAQVDEVIELHNPEMSKENIKIGRASCRERV